MKPKHILCGSRPYLTLVLAVVVSLGSTLQPVSAQPPAPPAEVELPEQPPGPVNQRQALERVRALFPGNVISINEVKQDERVRYRIRIDNEGNIYTVFVDQATGVISRE